MSRPHSLKLPTDVIAHILRGRVGPLTFARARQVSRTWAIACEDESLLCSIASYVDGLTRTQFRGLLHLTSEQARTYPHTTIHTVRAREWYLYTPAIVRQALHDHGGLDGIRARPVADWPNRRKSTWPRRPGEEELHQRKVARLAFECMKKLALESTREERQRSWQREREELRKAGVI
jgi:hypothetical protein